jgi:uncharacterized membrane protein YqhA
MVAKLLAWSRYLIVIAVLGSLLASFLVIVFAAYDIGRIALDVLRQGVDSGSVGKHVAVGAIELIEMFLLGIVLYVIALGMYQLFIRRDAYLPGWLIIRTLDDLKERLLSTVLVMLAVTFLGYAVTWDGTINIVGIGVAIALVIAALAYSIRLARQNHQEEKTETPSDE